MFAINLAGLMLDAGRREEVRGLAAHLMMQGPSRKVALEVIEGLVETSDASFGAAFERWTKLPPSLTNWATRTVGITRLSSGCWMSALSWVARSRSLATCSAATSSPEPPRLYAFDPFTPMTASFVCLRAGADSGPACVHRLQASLDRHYFRSGLAPGAMNLLEAVTNLYDGNAKAIANSLRKTDPAEVAFMAAELYDAAGEAESALFMDAVLEPYESRYHGATIATVRSARRADKHARTEMAAALAQQVLNAWSSADVELPVLKEMHAIVKRNTK